MLHKYTLINIQSVGVTLIRLFLVCSTRWRKPNLLWSSTILESEQEYRHKRLYSVNSDSDVCFSELVFCFAFACPAFSVPPILHSTRLKNVRNLSAAFIDGIAGAALERESVNNSAYVCGGILNRFRSTRFTAVLTYSLSLWGSLFKTTSLFYFWV